MRVSDLKLERAKQTLKTVRESSSIDFLKQLADISLLLFDQALDTEQISSLDIELRKNVESDLEESIDQLAELHTKIATEIDRPTIFWAFFKIAKSCLLGLRLNSSFKQTDVELRNFIDSHRTDFFGEEKIRVDYLVNGLGRDVLEHRLTTALNALRDQGLKAAEPLKRENDRSVESLQKLAVVEKDSKNLVDLLHGQTEKLNFIGLSQGFQRLSEETEKSISAPLLWLKVCSVSMLLVPAAGFFTAGLIESVPLRWWQATIPLVTIELALFFFFRVLLQRYQSLKAQLLQIKLRFNLCAFVENYSEFAARIRKSPDDRTLDKFEALIFSGITPDPQNVPSQFDGIDQLTNLLKAVSGGPSKG